MSTGVSRLDAARRRYGRLAAIYDLDPGQRLFYARARARAVESLRLSPGCAVLDVACGTGCNFPLVEARIGHTGRIVGVDLTPAMLSRARSRVDRHAWSNIELIEMDAAELSLERLWAAGALRTGQRFDAAICTLGLSVIPDWPRAVAAMLSMVRPGGRVAVMDGGYPARPDSAGEAGIARPLMWLICRLAAADCTRRPWLRVSAETDDATTERFALGYVNVASGTVRS
jgi:demethylmenaquinone methyltransferase/2-methoxy-6-polyprenyl-1,4-benzoquinol methylase